MTPTIRRSPKRNDARANCGFALVKYTGARGKSGTSDATAELMARIRCIFDKAGVIWQTGQLGKVDQGGGGMVAMYLANRNIDTVDAGVPVLSMHAPFECIAKLDLYMAYKGLWCVLPRLNEIKRRFYHAVDSKRTGSRPVYADGCAV